MLVVGQNAEQLDQQWCGPSGQNFCGKAPIEGDLWKLGRIKGWVIHDECVDVAADFLDACFLEVAEVAVLHEAG